MPKVELRPTSHRYISPGTDLPLSPGPADAANRGWANDFRLCFVQEATLSQPATSLPSAESRNAASDPDRGDIRIMIADPQRSLCQNCESILSSEGYDVRSVYRLEDAASALERDRFDIVAVDANLGDGRGLDVLAKSVEANPDMVTVLMTDDPTVEASLAAFSSGAWEYLPKPFSAVHLQVIIGRAAHLVQAARDRRNRGRRASANHGHSDHMPVIGRSTAFCELIDTVRRVALSDASVFLTGESGTGKEMIAQFLHHHSRRKGKEMVSVNCAALPEPLLESEMFGHRKGAFTGAVRDKPGLLETAHGGTLFLDELTEMPPTIQAKFLRVIQDGVVRRVGSESTDAVVNVRFIAATNRDPAEAVEEGVLRQDLYYRLRVIPIRIPSLRERKDDIPAIADHFLHQYWMRHRPRGEAVPQFAESAVQALLDQRWTGNVRELQNVIEHTVVLFDGDRFIGSDHIRFMDDEAGSRRDGRWSGSGMGDLPDIGEEDYHTARDHLLDDFERKYLVWLVKRTSANMSKAARIAGVDRTTLYRLMEKHGFKRDTVLTQERVSLR
jgi:DNA-binding NtrC family response regulator